VLPVAEASQRGVEALHGESSGALCAEDTEKLLNGNPRRLIKL